MAKKYTKADAESAFTALALACGKRVATSYNDVGAWRLHYEATGGGYNIEEIIGTHGSVCHPLGRRRRDAREFYGLCWFAIWALEARGVRI